MHKYKRKYTYGTRTYETREYKHRSIDAWAIELDREWDWLAHQTYRFTTPPQIAIDNFKAIIRKYDPSVRYFIVAAKAGAVHVHALIEGISPIMRLYLQDELSWLYGLAEVVPYIKEERGRGYVAEHLCRYAAEYDYDLKGDTDG